MPRSSPLLDVCLSADYRGKANVLNHAEFQIDRGEVVGLVGESGSGKSTIALAILRLLEFRGGIAKGQLQFGGRNLVKLSEREMRSIRGREIGLVLQSPLSALNPAMRIGDQIMESWRAHRQSHMKPYCVSDVLQLLEMVTLPAGAAFLKRYPHELSVGQAQRVLIAMSIVHRPQLLIADEPTSALDAVTQSEVLQLFSRLSRQLEMSILYISHDLLSVASICGRIAILRQGQVVEFGSTGAIFREPRHSYTRELIGSIPTIPAWCVATSSALNC